MAIGNGIAAWKKKKFRFREKMNKGKLQLGSDTKGENYIFLKNNNIFYLDLFSYENYLLVGLIKSSLLEFLLLLGLSLAFLSLRLLLLLEDSLLLLLLKGI